MGQEPFIAWDVLAPEMVSLKLTLLNEELLSVGTLFDEFIFHEHLHIELEWLILFNNIVNVLIKLLNFLFNLLKSFQNFND